MSTKNKTNYSEIIEYYAARNGMTMSDLLKKSGIGRTTYYTGKKQNKFNTEVLEKFASVLGVDVSDLVQAPKSSNEMQKEIEDIRERLRNINKRL